MKTLGADKTTPVPVNRTAQRQRDSVVDHKRLGVGILGAGPVTQAIHLPALATMPDLFSVKSVMDLDLPTAQAVAARAGARATTSCIELLEADDVDVVAVCSPNSVHADQVVQACEAGKLAVLCEKPIAVTRAEGRRILDAAKASRTHIVVGTMQVYDPAYQEAAKAWRDLDESATLISSKILIPPNGIFVDLATNLVAPSGMPPKPTPEMERDPVFQAQRIRMTMLGLASHNLPHIRSLQPTVGRIGAVRRVPPFGYSIVCGDELSTLELRAVFGGAWDPSWTLTAYGAEHELHIEFRPSYVLAGSARAEIRSANETQAFSFDVGGYESEWTHIFDIIRNGAKPFVSTEDAVADLHFALDLSDSIDQHLGVQS